MNQKKKVFISFLGTNGYGEVNYSFTKEEGTTTFFIQEAIFKEEIRKNKDFWNVEKDEVFFFVTALAKKNNYDKRAQFFSPFGEGKKQHTKVLTLLKDGAVEEAISYLEENPFQSPDPSEDGLKYRFAKLQEEGLIGAFQDVAIPNGLNEDEIWEIFARVVEHIGKDTELYFDITNGFRFLPMLTLAIIDYVTSVNNVVLKELYYGNFEARDKEKNIAPIQKLNSIIELGQWTEAVEMFTKAADAQKLKPLLPHRIGSTNKTLGQELFNLTEGIKTCRGKELVKDLKMKEVKDEVAKLRNNSKKGMKRQLPALLDKIESKVTSFNTATTENGFAAVEWCIEHDMIQQGYTLLQENTISWLIEHFEDDDFRDKELREIVRACLNSKKGTARSVAKWLDRGHNYDDYQYYFDVAEEYFEVLATKPGLAAAYRKITDKNHGGLRNDINHGGYNENAGSSENLKAQLQNLSNRILQIIQPSYK